MTSTAAVERGAARRAVVVLLHALVGWAYCGALVGVGRRLWSLDTVLIVHAIGAPAGFGLLSLHYFKRFAYTTPLLTAAAFLAVVGGLDAGIVAPVFEQSFAMFTSPLGTWIPFGLIFTATYLTGRSVRRNEPK